MGPLTVSDWDSYLSTLVPRAFDPAWSDLSDGVILNVKPTAWQNPEDAAIALSAPFGDPNSDWENPTTTHTVPLSLNTSSQLAILTANRKRNLLVIQNLSTATSPDAAPTFYIGFGQQAIVGQSLGLPPGVGIVLDIVCPRDAIYLTLGPQTNTDNTVVVAGVMVEGSLTPN